MKATTRRLTRKLGSRGGVCILNNYMRESLADRVRRMIQVIIFIRSE